MSFSEEDVEALGQQLNLVNSHLDDIGDSVGTIKNILLGFLFATLVGLIFTWLATWA